MSNPSHQSDRDPDAPASRHALVPSYATASHGYRSLIAPLMLLTSAIGILLVLYVMSTRERALPEIADSSGAPVDLSIEPQRPRATTPADADRQREILDIYFRRIVPKLDESLRRKHAAADRAVAQLRERLDGHRHGIPNFAHDVTSWGTRFGVLGRASKDSWNKWWNDDRNAAAARRYIEQKFRLHVMSERDLQEALETAVQQFASDLEADRNELFADIRLPLQASGVQIRIADERWDLMRRQMMSRASAIAESGAKDNLVSGLTAVTVSGVAGYAAERAVIQLIARVAPIIAAQLAGAGAAAGGGAMAGGAGSGGALGSVGGPAGTVIGIGVGLAGGVVVDWWMTDRFKDKLSAQCNRFIDTVRDQIIDGNERNPGLKTIFADAVRLSDDAQRKAILEVLLEEVGATTKPTSKD